MPETGHPDFEWRRTSEVAGPDGTQLWMHHCGGIGTYPPEFRPEWSTPCGTCENDFGGWRPLLVEYTGPLLANTTTEQDEQDLDAALRIAPGNTRRGRKYRWRHVGSGMTYDSLPAVYDPDRPGTWVREVAVIASTEGPWRPVDIKGEQDG